MEEGVRSRKYFPALDGVRGAAAVCVLLFHLGHWLHLPAFATNGGLGVDLFFCLSGYVLPAAYSRRSANLSLGRFTAIRLIRLMPLVVLAIFISTPYVIARAHVTTSEVPYNSLMIAVVLGVLAIPYFGAPDSIGGPQLFPLNGPEFTLFLELVANIFWWSARHIQQLYLAIGLTIASFICLPFMGFGGDQPDNFWSGFPHVAAPFFLGVALYHLDPYIPEWRSWSKLFWGLFFLTIVGFLTPIEVSLNMRLIWVAIVTPLLVFAGSRTDLTMSVKRIFLWAGALSYPIYCLHYPLFCWINGLYQVRLGTQNVLLEILLVVPLVLALSTVALYVYDQPIRRFLTLRLQIRLERLPSLDGSHRDKIGDAKG